MGISTLFTKGELKLRRLPALFVKFAFPIASEQRQWQHLFWILGAAIFRFNIVGAVEPDRVDRATDATPATARQVSR